MSGFVFTDPGGLTDRAQAFLKRHGRRVPFDAGLTGDVLRSVIAEVYGRPSERVVSLVEWAQQRYGGLSYPSGFFGAEVVFAPVCEPEDALQELEISDAISTGGPARASLSGDGTVYIGLDGTGVAEFPGLDSVIECDAMFLAASEMAATMTSFLHSTAQAIALAGRLSQADKLGLREVRAARGRHTFWFAGRSAMVYVGGAWSALRLGLPPTVQVWGASKASLDRVQQLL